MQSKIAYLIVIQKNVYDFLLVVSSDGNGEVCKPLKKILYYLHYLIILLTAALYEYFIILRDKIRVMP